MWIIMKETYAGQLGSFYAGQKYDLPEPVIQQLRQESPKCCRNTCAPWDEQRDVKAIEKAQLLTDAKGAKVWADVCQDKVDKLKQKADELVPVVSQKQKELKQAKGADKERKKLEFAKAHGELTTAIAEHGLMQLRADDAKKKAKQLAKQAGLEPEEKVDEPVDKQIDEVAEGQTVSA